MAELEGFRELVTAMNRLPDKLQRKVLRKGLRAGAAVMRKQARNNAPKDTGAIQRNIIIDNTSPRGRLGKVISSFAVGVETGKIGKITNGKITLGSKTRNATRRERSGEDPFYWIWQEKGYSAVGRRSVKGLGREGRRQSSTGARQIPGKHFLERAFNSTRGSVFSAIRSKLKTEIEKENGR